MSDRSNADREGSYGMSTRLVVDDYVPPPGFSGLNPAIHHASTIAFPNVAALRARDWKSGGYTYGLHGTPTTYTLENRIATIEGGRHCMLVPSGLAAIVLVDLALLKSGDRLLLPDNVYNPSRDLGCSMLAGFGVDTAFYDPMDPSSLESQIDARTKLIWFEAPGSVTMEIPDLPALVAIAKKHGVTTAIDNTWAAGLLFRPFDHGIDIAMHALTKYMSGASDVLMGSVTVRDDALHLRLREAQMRLGYGVGGDDCYLILRGLATMELRLAKSGGTGLELATWLKAQPEISAVLHPAFTDCPGHESWKRDFSGASGLFSVIIDPVIEEAKVDAMVDALKLFGIGFSWGGVHSLAVPYRIGAGGPTRSAARWPHAGNLVRFYAGTEDAQDLIDDLEQAFDVMRGR